MPPSLHLFAESVMLWLVAPAVIASFVDISIFVLRLIERERLTKHIMRSANGLDDFFGQIGLGSDAECSPVPCASIIARLVCFDCDYV